MIFPIGDTQVEQGHPAYFNHLFILVNVVIFVYQLFLGKDVNNFIMEYGAIPLEIANFQDLYTLLSSMFIHGGLFHLIGNMIFLWIFGDNIEATIGSPHYLLFYLMGGIIASIVHVYFNADVRIPAVGASGAIAAVMGAYLVMFPRSEIKMVLIILFRTFKISAFLFLGFWFLHQLISGIGTFSVTDSPEGGIAWWAHISGFVYGVLCGSYLRSNGMKVPPTRTKYLNDKFLTNS